QFDGPLAQAGQNGLVTTVPTIEIADGGNASPGQGLQIMEASDQLHSALLAHKVVDYTHRRLSATGAECAARHVSGWLAGKNPAGGNRVSAACRSRPPHRPAPAPQAAAAVPACRHRPTPA